jgi:SAM-dependent methyltransferase
VTALRYGAGGGLDAVDRLRGRDAGMIPPRRKRFVGTGDFLGTGREFLEYFRTIGGLHPTDAVLDIGSGIGRMAIPLTGYLRPPGSYEGFDIVPSGVEWCQQSITRRFPHFNFTVLNVYNKRYNPRGPEPSKTRFPYDAARFNFAFATSVFTHMLPADVERYIAEAARVLRPGGRLFATLFLTDNVTMGDGPARAPSMNFAIVRDGYRTVSVRTPEVAVGYDEHKIRDLINGHGFHIEEPVRYGTWRGRPGLSLQDIVVARKTI